MKLILVRHGESARNAGYDVLGEENNLTIKGVQQAIKVGAYLSDQKINTIYCSPALRCEQTMEEILRIRNDEIAIHFSSLLGPKMKKEGLEKLKARIGLFIDDLKYDFSEGGTVVVVSHQLPIRMFIYQLTGKDEPVDNGSVSVFEISEKDTNTIMVNETNHLK